MNEQLLIGIISLLVRDDIRNGQTEYVKEIREIAEELEPHFEEEYPKKLLRVQHPGEQPWMKTYRKERWQPKTRTATGRVYTTLQKIQQADDFKVIFKNDFKDIGITENNVKGLPGKYCLENLPKFGSVETWAFSIALSKYLENPNGLIFVGPDLDEWIKDPLLNAGTVNFEQPYPQIFCEEDICYRSDYGAIFKLEQYEAKDNTGVKKKWDQFLAVSMEGLVLARQIRPYKNDEDVFDTFVIPYNYLEFPIFTVGSVISEIEEGQIIYDSILTPCLPAWNDALFTNDDLLVNKALHSNPIFWRYRNSPCKTCNGTGYTANAKDETQKVCGTCHGNGLGSEGSPFASIEINLQKRNATNPDVTYPSGPPAGYVQLDIAALEAQKKDIDDDIYRGFQAIGIELLANVPASQSGIAKQYDRKELNTFFFQVAVHLGCLIEDVSFSIFLQRYRTEIDSGILSSEQIKANKPKVVIPSDYDVLTTQVLSENLAAAIKNQFDPIITSGLTAQYTEKVFGENSYQVKILNIKNALDPLINMTAEEKLLLKDSFGCTELDYITSAYLTSFVTELLEENQEWINLDRAKQREMVKTKAIEKQKEIKSGMVTLMP